MAITRSFGNGFEVQDFTGEINLIPNNWGTIGQLGLFEEISVAEHTVVFDEVDITTALLVDRTRGTRSQQNSDAVRKTHSVPIPHFPLDDAMYVPVSWLVSVRLTRILWKLLARKQLWQVQSMHQMVL